MNSKKEDKMDIRLSNRVEDVIEICKYFRKYEPESDAAVFMKDIIHGFKVGNVLLMVCLDGKEFRGGVVLTLISPKILWINFSYVNQDIKGLSKKFMVAILRLCKEIGIKKLQTKATQHIVAAEKKFGFTTAYTVIEKIIEEEIKKNDPPKKGG